MHKLRLPTWPKVRLGLRAKVILGFLVVVFPAFLLLAVSGYRQYTEERKDTLLDSTAAGRLIGAYVQSRVNRSADLARALLLYPVPEGGAVSDDPRLEALLGSYSDCVALFLLDRDGRLLAVAPSNGAASLDGSALQRAASAQGLVVSGIHQHPGDGRPVVELYVSDPVSARLAGVTVDVTALGREIADLAAGEFGVTLCDHEGRVICSTLSGEVPWEKRDLSSDSMLRQVLQGSTLQLADPYVALDGRAYVGAAVPVPELGWAVYIHHNTPSVLGLLGSRLGSDLFMLVALTLLGLVAAVVIANRLVTPIVHLARYARGLGRGQLNERIEIRSGDEMEVLAGALNTTARQMEERDRRLRARTDALEALITQSADGIAIYGPQGELQRMNPAGMRILGRTPNKHNMTLAEQSEFFRYRSTSAAHVPLEEMPVAAALRGEVRVGQEVRIEMEGKQGRVLSITASPLSDARGHIYGAVSIFRDISRAYRDRQEKDQFVSVVSHELKTPITSIKGYAQMLLRRAEQSHADERDLKGLRIINEEVDRMVGLINQLLDVSRLDLHRLEMNIDRMDLTALARDSIDRLQMTTNRHTLRLRAPQEPIWVPGDRTRLAQVFGNLLMNAIHYSPDGGPIEVSLESQEGRAWASVRDWGVGIAPEDQSHIFQRFYRGTRKGLTALTGMGLGLFISREIVQRHRGDITFHSQPGQGTTFLFWLPLAGPM
jgi:two-component system, OmpR family, phosphate regulon sensor histidine kinase PhoR